MRYLESVSKGQRVTIEVVYRNPDERYCCPGCGCAMRPVIAPCGCYYAVTMPNAAHLPDCPRSDVPADIPEVDASMLDWIANGAM